jgi:hypothetical protein
VPCVAVMAAVTGAMIRGRDAVSWGRDLVVVVVVHRLINL